MAASHTELKPLNFPLVFQNRGGCRFFSLAQCALRSVEETPIERRPKIVMHTEVAKKKKIPSEVRFRILAQMELMEKNTVCLILSRATHKGL